MSATLPVRQRKSSTSDKSYKHSTTTRLLDRQCNHFNQVIQSASITTTLRDRNDSGTVIRPAKEPRSFIVKNDRTEGFYRRARSQLKPRLEVKDNSFKEPLLTTPETTASQDSSATPPQDGQTYTTRSGRISKPPDRLDT